MIHREKRDIYTTYTKEGSRRIMKPLEQSERREELEAGCLSRAVAPSPQPIMSSLADYALTAFEEQGSSSIKLVHPTSLYREG